MTTALPVPQNPDIEMALLGGLILDPVSIKLVAGILDPVNFYVHRHRWVYEALMALDKRGAVSQALLINELDQQNKLAEIGGAAFITQLIRNAAPIYQIEEYAKEIHDDATRREMLKAANTIGKTAYQENVDIMTCLADMHAAVLEVEKMAAGQSPAITASEAVADRYNYLIEGKGKGTRRIVTWIDALDDILDGIDEDDFVIFAGRPGIGKTSLLLSIASRLTVHGEKGALFSLEMPRSQLADRLVSMGGMDLRKITGGQMDDDNQNKYIAIALPIIDSNEYKGLLIDDYPYLTPESYRGKMARYTARHNITYGMIDYLQLMTAPNKRNRLEEVTAISRQCKLVSRELHRPTIVGAQLSRAVERRSSSRPRLADLRESGSLEQDADIIVFVYVTEENEEITNTDSDGVPYKLVTVEVAKHRNGATGSCEVAFRLPYTRFGDPITITDPNGPDLGSVV